MANKNNIDLSGFDFGFSIVDEDELSAVTSVKAEVEAATDTSKAWKAQNFLNMTFPNCQHKLQRIAQVAAMIF